MHRTPSHPTYREAFGFWLRLGFISFGGPAGQIAILHDYLVEKKRWISPSKFLHALNYCMLLPGPEAQQLVTYMGWMLHGTRGGLAAGILFVLPSAIIMWGLSALYVTYGHLDMVQAVFEWLKPAVLALVIGAIVKIGKKSVQTTWHFLVALLAFVCLYFFQVPFPAIIAGSICIGWASILWANRFNTQGLEQQDNADTDESSYLLHRLSNKVNPEFSSRALALQVGWGVILWSLPLFMFYFFVPEFDFWKKLVLFFSKAAFVTVGGAYAVLPYVAQVSVDEFSWLSRPEMLDGMALGETTPGPLIIVLAFVGFLAGHHHFSGSLWAATLGLSATVWYTFLPSFLFIFVGAPIIERTHAHPAIRTILQYASAAVTGVILCLCLNLGQAVITTVGSEIHWVALAWALISLIALQVMKVHVIAWIGVSIAVGLGKHLLYTSI